MMQNIELIELCKTFTEDRLKEFEDRVMEITDLEQTFGDEIERLNDDESVESCLDRIPALDEVLKKYIDKISEEALAHLAGLSFQDGDKIGSYRFSKIIVDEALKRESILIQKAIAKAFVAAQDNYDEKYRYYDNNFFRMLQRDELSKFDESALAIVLGESEKWFFDHIDGDETNTLYVNYFNKTEDAESCARIFSDYKRFIIKKDIIGDCDTQEYLLGELNKLKGNALIGEKVEGLIDISKLIIAGFREYDEELTPKFFTQICNDLEALSFINWYKIFGGDEPDNPVKLEYETAFNVLKETTYLESFTGRSAANFFFNLLFDNDKDRLEKDMISEFEESGSMKEFGTRFYFEIDEDEYELFRDTVIAKVAGKSEEEAVKIANETVEAKHKAKELEEERANELTEIYRKTADDRELIKDLINLAAEFAKDYGSEPEKLKGLVDILYMLLLKSVLVNNDPDNGKLVLDCYIDKVLPYAGLTAKSLEIANYAIKMSNLLKDSEMFNKIEEKIFSTKYSLESIPKSDFQFNLAIHYAIVKDKESMFKAMNKSFDYGRKKASYLESEYFADYQNDEDFLELVDSRGWN